MKRISVSKLESVNKYLTYDWFTEEKLIDSLSGKFESNKAMDLGTDFHKIIEDYPNTDFKGALTNTDFSEIEIQKAYKDLDLGIGDFELSYKKVYKDTLEPVIISCRADWYGFNRITDIKTTSKPNIDESQYRYYQDSYQWRLYLDIFNLDLFEYKVFNLKEKKGVVNIVDFNSFSFERYNGMNRDCINIINETIELSNKLNINLEENK